MCVWLKVYQIKQSNIHHGAQKLANFILITCRGSSPYETDCTGITPLMIACETGRSHNVTLLLKHAKKGREKIFFY